MIRKIIMILIIFIFTGMIKLLALQPVLGGEIIYDKDHDINCTAGFNGYSKDHQQKILVTAGHCFNDNQDVYNASDQLIGHVINVLYNEDIDIEFIEYEDSITSEVMPYIYTDKETNPVPVISGATDPVAYGDEVYVYSDKTEHKYKMISIQNPESTPGKTYLYSDYYDPQQIDLINGVSGSPVYRYVPGGIEIIGIVNAVSGPLVLITTYSEVIAFIDPATI